MKILIPASFDGYAPRKDGSFSLRFVTQEQTPAQVGEIHSMLNKFGYLLFKAESELTKDEIEGLDSLDSDLYDNPKTKSQRLRNVLYKLWEQDKPGNDFKDFYASKMEQMIIHYKDKLNE